MPVFLDIHARIEGADVADAKAQLVSLFGVALGRVAVVDETASAPSALNANGALSNPVPVVMDTAAQQSNLAAQAETPTRRRRTRAEIDAAKAAEAIENAPQPEPQTPVNGAAVAAADEPEETIDLLGGGNAEEEVEDPFAEDPPKQAAATSKLDKDAMMAKGRDVLNKHGMPKLTAILAKHGFKRIAELPEHTYPTVWADLEESLATAP